MKLSTRSILPVTIAITTLFMLSCKKKPFKSGVGLYSVKQYHCYKINPSLDTNNLGDRRISILGDNNVNYLTWDNRSFHLDLNVGDTVKTFINDSSIGGITHPLYKLQYWSVTDQVLVTNEAKDTIWQSF